MRRKHKRPVSLPPQGDVGPDTPAQRAGAVILDDVEDSGLVFRRKRRDHALEIMAASKCHNGKRKRPEISARQCAAGLKLHELYCMTELSAETAFSRIYVDTSPNPGAISLAQAERVTRFIALSRHIPPALKGPVWHVAIKGLQLRAGYSRDAMEASMHKAQLQVALDILANHLGI